MLADGRPRLESTMLLSRLIKPDSLSEASAFRAPAVQHSRSRVFSWPILATPGRSGDEAFPAAARGRSDNSYQRRDATAIATRKHKPSPVVRTQAGANPVPPHFLLSSCDAATTDVKPWGGVQETGLVRWLHNARIPLWKAGIGSRPSYRACRVFYKSPALFSHTTGALSNSTP